MAKSKKRTKRSNGEGTTVIRKDGRWERKITIIDPKTGLSKPKSFYGKTEAEAMSKSKRFEAETLLGQYIEPTTITLEQWLLQWLEAYKSTTVSRKTFDEYERLINSHIIPSLGKMKLQSLKTTNIMKMYNQKLKNGRLDGKEGGLGPTSIKRIHVVLKMALSKAVDEDIILKNPANACILPKNTKSDPPVLSKEDYNKLINYDSGHRYSLAFNIFLASGLRASELRALKWNNVDFENGTIRVEKTYSNVKSRDDEAETAYVDILKEPKTEESKRLISLPKQLVNKLKEHRIIQLEEIIQMGSKYTKNNLVFCTNNGNPIFLRNLEKYWKNFLDSANVKNINLHGTRHSFASLLLEANIPRDTVKKVLGHSQKSNTIDIYSHPSQESMYEVSNKIEELMNAAPIVEEVQDDYKS